MGGTGRAGLIVEKYDENSGYFEGRFTIGDPLHGSGSCVGVLNSSVVRIALKPRSGVTNRIQFSGAVRGNKIVGEYQIPTSTIGRQSGRFDLTYLSSSTETFAAANKIHGNRILNEAKYFQEMRERAKNRARAISNARRQRSSYSPSTRDNADWERNKQLKRQADQLEEQTRLMRREASKRLLERGY